MDYLENIDHFLLHLINGQAGINATVDSIVMLVLNNYVLKGIPVFMIWWGLWFYGNQHLNLTRSKLLATLLISILAIFVGRLLALNLPFRLRPLHNPEIETLLPTNISPAIFDGWSSMPSDHAVLFFALAASIFLIHRTFGVLLVLHAALVIGLPRIYAGIHFPSDIVVGAIIGIIMAFAFLKLTAQAITKTAALRIEAKYGYLFYPVLFFITFQAASMFDSLRRFLSAAYKIAKLLVAAHNGIVTDP